MSDKKKDELTEWEQKADTRILSVEVKQKTIMDQIALLWDRFHGKEK